MDRLFGYEDCLWCGGKNTLEVGETGAARKMYYECSACEGLQVG
jgi:hypothetical protein